MNRPPAGAALLRRLRLTGLLAPIAFVLLLLAGRPILVAALGLTLGYSVLGVFFVGCAAAFGLAMWWMIGRALATNVEAERLSAALVERDRIARELHDSLAQVLGVAHLRLRTLQARDAITADPRVSAEVNDLADLCQAAHRDIREAIHGLKDAHDPARPLVEHLDDFTRLFARTSGIPTTLRVLPDRPLALPPAAAVQVVRVVQEALANVRKHAGARSAQVLVHPADTYTDFVVADDGRGFTPAESTHRDGFGLTTMRERVESVGGHLRIESTPGEGTRVTVRVPHPAPARARVEELTA